MTYDNNLIFEVSCLYYEDNLTQDSIARRLNISKYKVNRVLKRAQQEGLVQIKILKPGKRDFKKIIKNCQ